LFSGCAIVHQKRLSNGARLEASGLTSGSYFGTVALIVNVLNAATIKAEGYLMCVSLNADGFGRLVELALDL
jgi:hypothetical protein